MRTPLLLVLGLLLTACAGSGDVPGGEADPAPTSASASASPSPTAAPSVPPASDGLDPCTLVEADRIESLLGSPAKHQVEASPMGLPSCQWSLSPVRYLQVLSVPAGDWAGQVLPGALEMLDTSGQPVEERATEALREAADRIEAGEEIGAREACTLFSGLLALQGHGPDLTVAVQYVPRRRDAVGVTAQACELGRFTSIGLFDTEGLERPLPQARVEDALVAAVLRATEDSPLA